MSGTTNNVIHRAKTWQLAGFALNNVSTNLYMWMMTFIAYYLQGFIGVATVLATSYVTVMRIWDGVFSGWTLFTILFMGLTIAFNGFNQICSSVVITMTADVTDYETYRTKKYLPGMIGTLFSFVDKIISSFAASIIGVMCAMIGFADALPTAETPYSTSLFVVGMIGMYGLVLVGLICNVIAMKYYPLTKEKMEEIQGEIAAIKANAAQAK